METGEKIITDKVLQLRAQLQRFRNPLQKLQDAMDTFDRISSDFSPLFPILKFDPFSIGVESLPDDKDVENKVIQSGSSNVDNGQILKQKSNKEKQISGISSLEKSIELSQKPNAHLNNKSTAGSESPESRKLVEQKASESPVFKLHSLNKQLQKEPLQNRSQSINSGMATVSKLLEDLQNQVPKKGEVFSHLSQGNPQNVSTASGINRKTDDLRAPIATANELLRTGSNRSNLQYDANQSSIKNRSGINPGESLLHSKGESESETYQKETHWTNTIEALLQDSSLNSVDVEKRTESLQETKPVWIDESSDFQKNLNQNAPSETPEVKQENLQAQTGLSGICQTSLNEGDKQISQKTESSKMSPEDVADMVNTVLLRHAKLHGVQRL